MPLNNQSAFLSLNRNDGVSCCWFQFLTCLCSLKSTAYFYILVWRVIRREFCPKGGERAISACLFVHPSPLSTWLWRTRLVNLITTAVLFIQVTEGGFHQGPIFCASESKRRKWVFVYGGEEQCGPRSPCFVSKSRQTRNHLPAFFKIQEVAVFYLVSYCNATLFYFIFLKYDGY